MPEMNHTISHYGTLVKIVQDSRGAVYQPKGSVKSNLNDVGGV